MTIQSANEDLNIAWQKWLEQRDPHAGDSLIRTYMPLVHYHVHRIAISLPKGIKKDELISLGLLGLFDALEKFDHKRDLKFDTYASFRIRGAILDGLRKEDRLPRSLREKSKKIEAATEQLEQKHMRNVTVKEIADELDMTTADVQSTMTESFFGTLLSIDENNPGLHEDSGFVLKDNVTATPEEQLVKQELIEELATVIKTLTANEQMVLTLFYHEELTLTEIGQIMALSTSRISQIHSKALMKLKKTLQSHG